MDEKKALELEAARKVHHQQAAIPDVVKEQARKAAEPAREAKDFNSYGNRMVAKGPIAEGPGTVGKFSQPQQSLGRGMGNSGMTSVPSSGAPQPRLDPQLAGKVQGMGVLERTQMNGLSSAAKAQALEAGKTMVKSGVLDKSGPPKQGPAAAAPASKALDRPGREVPGRRQQSPGKGKGLGK